MPALGLVLEWCSEVFRKKRTEKPGILASLDYYPMKAFIKTSKTSVEWIIVLLRECAALPSSGEYE